MSDALPIVEEFMGAFGTRDVDTIMAYFTEDAVYHNMPMSPVRGTEAIRGVVKFFVDPAESIEFQILSIMASGDSVLTERLDKFVINGSAVELPVMGAFEVRGGKIAAWRDYFDMATWQKQMG